MKVELRPAAAPLTTGPLYRFADWPETAVPRVSAGVYTVWSGDQFVYVGMSGRGMTADDLRRRQQQGKPAGLYTRLASHASGGRSGDQFCVYVADRFVLPLLATEQIAGIAGGILPFDELVRGFIHAHLSYRFVVTADGQAALALEKAVVAHGLAGVRPVLNAALVKPEG